MSSASNSTRVKICGITNLPDARAAAQAGADFLGYIMFPKSPRYIGPTRVRQITDHMRVEFPGLLHVAVFVDASEAAVCQAVQLAGVDFAQLHGTEPADYCRAIAEQGIRHLKVLKYGGNAPSADWSEFQSAEYLLCDTYDTKAAGGTGRAFAHNLLPGDLPRDRMFLAGGLTPENVSSAIEAVHPFAVDVSSGVEARHGIKDHDKVRRFLQQAKRITA